VTAAASGAHHPDTSFDNYRHVAMACHEFHQAAVSPYRVIHKHNYIFTCKENWLASLATSPMTLKLTFLAVVSYLHTHTYN